MHRLPFAKQPQSLSSSINPFSEKLVVCLLFIRYISDTFCQILSSLPKFSYLSMAGNNQET